MEVNADDIVIKSNDEEEMLADIKETLDGLQAINLKLNPNKSEADEAFRRMKELLEALPTVTVPIKGETLTMYLAASEESISAVLMVERGKKQILVYFVISDKPIKQILARLEKSGRIAKWAIESGEHEIEFRGKNSVKGQILADFLAEIPTKEEEGAKDKEAKRKEPEPEKAW
ncbi:hypothetical protein Tco_1141926, partial [Tanacetum coccineum]